MLLKLERQFGLRGIVLKWFQSYLCDRTLKLFTTAVYVVHCSRLLLRTTRISTPPAAVYYVAYTADLEEVDEHGVNAYADDTYSCICVVSATTRRLLLRNSNIVSRILINGRWPTVLGSIRRRRSSCGLVPSTASPD